MLFNLDLTNNTTLSSFLFFFIIGLYFLIPAVITQISYPTAELIVPIGIQTKKAKPEMKTHPVIVGITISKFSI